MITEVPSSLQRRKHGVQRNADPQDPEIIQNPELNSDQFGNFLGIKIQNKSQSRMQLARFTDFKIKVSHPLVIHNHI